MVVSVLWTFGLTPTSNFLVDLLMMVLSWIMISSESPVLVLRIEHSAMEIGSLAAILEICSCCSVVNPTNLRVASPSVIRPSKHLRFEFGDIGERRYNAMKVALQSLSVGVLIAEMLSKAMVSDRLRFPKGLLRPFEHLMDAMYVRCSVYIF